MDPRYDQIEVPLNPARDDEFADDYVLDHGAAQDAGFDSHNAGCMVANHEAISEFNGIAGTDHGDLMTNEDFDIAVAEGEGFDL